MVPMRLGLAVFLVLFLGNAAAEDMPPRPGLAIDISGSQGAVQVHRVFADRSLRSPSFLTHAGDGTGRLFVGQKNGVVQVLYPDGDRVAHADIFLAITDRVYADVLEAGLLSLAFHPDFAHNGRFFVYYTAPGPLSRVSEFRLSDHPDRADPGSERILLEVPQSGDYHFGGQVAFGPDGFLYIGLGDGGQRERAQDLSLLHGSILRLDPDGQRADRPYAVPADNPLIGNARGWRPEIWAWGLRNPWRFSFDPLSGMLWAGDVGGSLWEEIDQIEPAGNYGWPDQEGPQCIAGGGCGGTDSIAPVWAYAHEGGRSVTGGYVYRGNTLIQLQGVYVYGDFVTGQIWGLRLDAEGAPDNTLLAVSPSPIASFGLDEAGEIYVVGFDGALYVLAQDEVVSDLLPSELKAVGLFADSATQSPVPGLIPYSVNAQLWSDGAFKTRFLALPESGYIDFGAEAPWTFPPNTVLVKNFYIEMAVGRPESHRMIETRLLVKNRQNAGWSGFSYRWNEAGTNATLLQESRTDTLIVADPLAPGGERRRPYYFPSRADCQACHTAAAGHVLGLHTAQLNRLEEGENLLRTLERLAVFSAPLPASLAGLPRLSDPTDLTENVERRARSYLDANCASCHRPGGTSRSAMDLRFAAPLEALGLGVAPVLGDLGVLDARLVAPGAPERSVLYRRMTTLDENRMPPLATQQIDVDGVDAVRRWIAGLAPAPETVYFADVTLTHLPATLDGPSMDARPADFDGDGDLDLLVASEFAANILLLNDGEGSFTDHSADRVPRTLHDSEDIGVADFDHDGDLDAVVVSEDDRTDEVYLNDGEGFFAAAPGSLEREGISNAVLARDVDGDGWVDLLVGNGGPQGEQNLLLRNNGSGRFLDATAGRLPAVVDVTQDLEWGDIDGDGDGDLLVGNEGPNYLLRNDGSGVFVRAPLPLRSQTEETREVDLGDVDGDGDLDILCANVVLFNHRGVTTPQNRLLYNDGQGGFTDLTAATLPIDQDNSFDGDFADLDGDGDLDIITANALPAGPYRVYFNDGGGRFLETTRAVFSPDLIGQGFDVEVADFDLDGRLDLYLASREMADRLLLGRDIATSVPAASLQPEQTILAPNFPNPFNSSTTILFSLGQSGPVELTLFNLVGQAVRYLLVRDDLAAGSHQVRWDGRMQDGRPAASGLYVYRLRSGTEVLSRKLLLMR